MNNLLHRVPLRTRMLLVVALGFVTVSVCQIILINIFEGKRATQTFQVRMQLHAASVAQHFKDVIDGASSDIRFLANSWIVQDIVRASEVNSAVQSDHINLLKTTFLNFARYKSVYYQIRLIGIADGGRELVRCEMQDGQPVIIPDDELQKKGERDYFKAAVKLKPGEIYISDINLNREHGSVEIPHRRTLRIAAPLYNSLGQEYGLIAINMDIGGALDKIRLDTDKDVRVYVTNQDGDFLVNPDPARTFGFDLGHRYRWQNDISGYKRLSGKDVGESILSSFAMQGESFIGLSHDLRLDPRQPERFVRFIFAIPADAIQDMTANVTRVIITSSLIMALIIMLLLIAVLSKMIRPIREMVGVADLIGRGEFQVSIPASQDAEIGSLANALREMLARLDKRNNEIVSITEKLRESESYANQIIDTVPEVVLVVEANGLILRANARVQILFGYEPEELMGQPVEILIPHHVREKHPGLREEYVKEPVQRLMGKGRELFGLHKSGREIPVEIGLDTLWYRGRQCVVVSVVDITQRKHAEQNQKRLLARLTQVNEELNSFTYIASHDLKSPLRGIENLATWIEEDLGGAVSPGIREHLDMMHGRIRRMRKLLDDLLLFSRIGRVDYPSESVDTAALNREIFELLANEKDIQLNIQGDMPVLTTQRIPLELVFRNLLSNAIKHHDGEKGIITTGAKRVNSMVEFYVKDDGPGIPAEHQQRVFGMFQTLKSRDQVEGSGIGLSIVKKTIESLGGQIRFESDGKSGCIFYFTWPIDLA